MKKHEEIYESYINGNISWVKQQVKKMSKTERKALYKYVQENYLLEYFKSKDTDFFFNLI